MWLFGADSLNTIFDATKSPILPLNFSHGLCGISWGLIYLQQQGFLEVPLIEEHLQKTDDAIFSTDIDTIDILSFSEGLGGIMCYWITRWLFLRKQGKSIPFRNNFTKNILEKIEKILQLSSNVFIVNYALQFKYLMENEVVADSFYYAPSICDWTNYPLFLAKNPQYWKSGINGCTGIGLLTMLALTSNK